jgi:hypothetical protein
MATDLKLFNAADATLTTNATSTVGPFLKERSIAIQATWDVTTPTSAATVPGTLEVQTVTFPDKATAVDGDYVVLEDYLGTKWALALSKSGAAVKTLTFLAKASCTGGDFLVFYDAAGQAWAIAANKSGTDAAPTAQSWIDIPSARKANVNISSATTGAQVAALFETAMNALTGFSTAFTTDDSAADGTMLLACDAVGAVAEPLSFKKNAGSGLTSSAGTSIVGVESTAGYTTSAPTGAIWAAIPSAKKGSVDLTACTDAASVAAAAELVFDALVGVTIVSDDTAADGTMTFTQAEPGATVNPVVKNKTDAGAGSITGVQTTGGVGGVNLTADTVYTAAHGLATGTLGRMTTTTALPTGLSLLTDYYVIRVSANEYAFADSLAHAQAGTKINLTGRGTGTHTFTPTALSASTKLQKSLDGSNWVDVANGETLLGANSQTISADGSYIWTLPDCPFPYIRQTVTIAAGQLTMESKGYAK